MRKFLKVVGWALVVIIILVTGSLIFLDSRWGQSFVRRRVEAYLRHKLQSELYIGYIGYSFPKYIVLGNTLFLDRQRDTLLDLKSMRVDLSMLELLHKKISVQQIQIDGVVSHIYRHAPDTAFNFSYIIQAFTGNKQADTASKGTGSSFSFDLDRVRLSNIHARFDDQTAGTNLGIDLDNLELKMKKFDLDKLEFYVKDLEISGLKTNFAQDTSYLRPTPKETSKGKLVLIADNVFLQHVGLQYNNNLNKFLFALQLGSLRLKLNQYRLSDNYVDLDKLAIANSAATLDIGKSSTPPAPIDTIVKIDTTEGWNVRGRDIDLAGLNFKLDNENEPRKTDQLDYSHLDIHGLALHVQNISYADSLSGDMLHFSFMEQCGLNVRELKTKFRYSNKGVVLNDLYLKTPATLLQHYAEVHYESLNNLQKDPGALQVNVAIAGSSVGIHDLALLVPQLQQQDFMRKYPNDIVRLDVLGNGTLNNLNITRLYIKGFGRTEALLAGRISGLPDAARLDYDLRITRFSSTRHDIDNLLPPGTIPTSVNLPEYFEMTGTLAGTTRDYKGDMLLTSSDGNAHLKGDVITSTGKGNEKYAVSVNAQGLNVGHLIKQDTLIGKVTANVDVDGYSFDIKQMKTSAKGKILSAVVKGYNYHDVDFSANVAEQKGKLGVSVQDSNLRVNIACSGDFSKQYASVQGNIKIDSADLRALKLSKSELRTKGNIVIDIPVLNPDYPDGRFTWYQSVILASGNRYFADSLYVISKPSGDTQHINVDLNILDAVIAGPTPLTKVWPIVQEHINRHYSSLGNDSLTIRIGKSRSERSADTSITASYQLSLRAHLSDKPLLHSILPGLGSFDSVHVDAAVDPATLTFNAATTEINYRGTSVENASVQVKGTDSALVYKVNAGQLSFGNFTLYDADIHGSVDKNNITTDVSINDNAKQQRFAIKANMVTTGDAEIIHLQPGLVLDYNKWNTSDSNKIVLLPGGFYVQDFALSNKDQSIKANSEVPAPNKPVRIDFQNFQLANITDIASKNDTLLASGAISGNVTIDQVTPAVKAEGDLTIHNLAIYNDTLGDVAIKMTNPGDKFDAQISLTGNGNDMTIAGSYSPDEAGTLDATVNINALAIHSIEGATGRQITASSGYLRGKLDVQGTFSAPDITGEIHTDNLKTTVRTLNSAFTMPAEKITFSGHDVKFENFTIRDSSGNKAVISGSADITDLVNPQLNLQLKADKWRAIHSTAADNKELYGDLLVSADLKVNGTPAIPSIDGDINVLKGTKLSVVNPQKDPEIQSSKGIVIFINERDTSWGKTLMPEKTDTVRTKTTKLAAGSGFNLNINVNKEAEFNMIIDEASGDFISVKGDAYLNTAVNAAGDISLTGTYLLHSGVYQMNYNFIKRRFQVQDGSQIVFGGDPLKNTILDVTAVYRASAAPYDLVMKQVPDPVQLNYYKQRLPFDVNLHMKGDMMHPTFTFDVVLPEDKIYPLSADQIELVQSKLAQVRQDTSELNKQVFAMLILGRFVSDDPFSSGASEGVGFTAIQSVSTFIGEQLNRAASNLIKGIDLTVDLATTADYTTGDMRQRTDLNVAASKRVLNDRLKLTVGNDFEVEGPQANNNTSDQSSLVPSNLSANYLLSSDGRYAVEVYRRNYDEGVLEGYVTETGVSFIVSLDYNRFKDVLRKKNKNDDQVNTPASK